MWIYYHFEYQAKSSGKNDMAHRKYKRTCDLISLVSLNNVTLNNTQHIVIMQINIVLILTISGKTYNDDE